MAARAQPGAPDANTTPESEGPVQQEADTQAGAPSWRRGSAGVKEDPLAACRRKVGAHPTPLGPNPVTAAKLSSQAPFLTRTDAHCCSL